MHHDTHDKGMIQNIADRARVGGVILYHPTQNSAQIKTYELINSEIFHLIFLDHCWLQVTETTASETTDEGWLLYSPGVWNLAHCSGPGARSWVAIITDIVLCSNICRCPGLLWFQGLWSCWLVEHGLSLKGRLNREAVPLQTNPGRKWD